MATLINDVITEVFAVNIMIAGTSLQRQRTQSERHDPLYRNRSASCSSDTSRNAPASHTQTTTTQPIRFPSRGETGQGRAAVASTATLPQDSSTSGASRFPSPPSSTSSETSPVEARPQHGTGSSYMASSGGEPFASARLVPSTATPNAGSSAAHPSSNQIPSPASDNGPRWNNSLGDLVAARVGSVSSNTSSASPASPVQTQTTIHVRDLAHILSLARDGMGQGSATLNDLPLQAMKYEISAMPINDVIEMVAALLTKITTTNDQQHDAMHRNAAHVRQAQAAASTGSDPNSLNNEHMSPLSSSVLAFHGKNVPSITIVSYLSRIHKYCPTTYEVFLSLLVYFDRMTERVNDMVVSAEGARQQIQDTQSHVGDSRIQQPGVTKDPDVVMRDDGDGSDEVDSDLADDDDEDNDSDEAGSDQPLGSRTREGSGGAAMDASSVEETASMPSSLHQATYFVVDSFNIHRLIIAGVTCASKFFSDVFYTNSRYAKVGGLPLPELNHLELQFLLLNDFRLAVPVEDLEAYATMLVEFYVREVASQRSRPGASPMESRGFESADYPGEKRSYKRTSRSP